ncbi:MAG: helix-turn-helix domain-containing protein, partial [Gammaproteobacteria bacterium]
MDSVNSQTKCNTSYTRWHYGKKYNQLTSNERHTIAFLQREGKKARQIGAALGRSTSTITREI